GPSLKPFSYIFKGFKLPILQKLRFASLFLYVRIHWHVGDTMTLVQTRAMHPEPELRTLCCGYTERRTPLTPEIFGYE
ncbi:MAG: hypothetical protein ACI8VE_001936, partial [Natrialbaceae archaeon]